MDKRALVVAPGDVYESLAGGRYAPLVFSGFNVERVSKKLADKNWDLRILQDEDASKQNILDFFQKTSSLSNGDQVLFYFCGHGDFSFLPGHGEPTDLDGDEFLVLYDKTLEFWTGSLGAVYAEYCLTDNELTQIVSQHVTKGIAFTAILDCCHAAGMVDALGGTSPTKPTFLFASSTEGSLSFGNRDTSFFTEALLMASNETDTLRDLKKMTEENLNSLYPDQQCEISFDPGFNAQPNFL